MCVPCGHPSLRKHCIPKFCRFQHFVCCDTRARATHAHAHVTMSHDCTTCACACACHVGVRMSCRCACACSSNARSRMICPGLGKTRANTQRSGYLLYWFGGKHASYSHSLSGLPRYPRTKRPERQHKRIARRGPCPVQAHYEPATSSPPCLTAHQASRPARAHLGRRSWVGRHRQAAGRMGAHARSPRITVP